MTDADKLRKLIAEADSGCWLWMGRRDKNGYGKCGKSSLAHRVAYEAFRGPIPNGLVLDHLCGVPQCVNPEHLEPVSQHENMMRTMDNRFECANGHAYDDANTYRVGLARFCRKCRAAASRRHYWRNESCRLRKR